MARCLSTNSGLSSLIASFILALLLPPLPFSICEEIPKQPRVSVSVDAGSPSNVASHYLSWLQQAGFTDHLCISFSFGRGLTLHTGYSNPPPCTVQVFKSDRKVAVHISHDGASEERGLVAVRNIRSGEKMVRIPLSAALTLHPAEDPEPYPDSGWVIALAAKLLREFAKSASSRWHPYLASFPRHHPIPWLHFGEMQLPELQYEPTQRRIAAFQVEVQEAWLRSDQSVVGNASWGEFAWAVNVVWTGAVTLRVPPGNEWRHMLIPLADLVNHSHHPNTFWLDRAVTEEHLELVASSDMAPGTPLLMHYEGMTSEAMFLMYGFVPSDNPEDTTVLFSSLSEAVAWYRRRYLKERTEAGMLGLLEVARKGAVREMKHVGRKVDLHRLDPHPDSVDAHDNSHGGAMVIYRHATVDTRLLGALAMLERERTGAFWEAGEDEWRVDVDAAFYVVSRRAAEMLTGFPTTLDEDSTILSECGGGGGSCLLSPSMLLAVRFRSLKKRMLQEVVDTHPPVSIHRPNAHLLDHSEL